MRILLLFCCLLVAGLWLAPSSVGASDASERAEMLENSLQAVEWYTNESVRKALQAESNGDAASARLFGDKAVESDQKAQGLRQQTADAWLAAGKPEQAWAVWHRAAEMAQERGNMLGKRIPVQLQQWQQTKGRGEAAADLEHEKQYLLAVFFTAQHHEVVARFSAAAGEPEQQRAALKELQVLLPPLQHNNRLAAVLAGDPHLADYSGQLQHWQQLVSSAAIP